MGLLNNPESAKLSSEGRMYVADLKNDRIQVFNMTATPHDVGQHR